MALLQTLQRSLLADHEGVVETVFLSVRLTARDSGYCTVRSLESPEQARAYFGDAGRTFRPPTLSADLEEQSGALRTKTVTRPTPVASTERFAGIGDEACVWRGYGNNQRGVIKFRVGQYVGEVNAPSVEEAGALATHLVAMLTGP